MSAKQYTTIEKYGRFKWDAVLYHGDRVLERTAFRSRREAMQFIRLIERAGIPHNPPDLRPARGGAPVGEVPFDLEPNGPIGFDGDFVWPDGGPVEPIDLRLDEIDVDDIPF